MHSSFNSRNLLTMCHIKEANKLLITVNSKLFQVHAQIFQPIADS
jgi:hypothetical protein